MANYKILLGIFIYCLTSYSCSKELEYPFVVINESSYFLDEIEFDWCQRDHALTVGPNETSDTFTLIYKTSGANAFGNGALCLRVDTYSDQDSVFNDLCGTSRDRSFFDESKINIVRIKIDPEPFCESTRFTFDYQ